jgi:hypothetical protein
MQVWPLGMYTDRVYMVMHTIGDVGGLCAVFIELLLLGNYLFGNCMVG